MWTLMSVVFRLAVRDGLLDINPCAGGEMLYVGTRVDTIWSSPQVGAFLAQYKFAYMQMPLLIGLWTGQLEGDVLRLKWSQYDGQTLKLNQRKGRSRLNRSTLAAILEGAKMMIILYRSVGIVATIAGYGLALLAATILSAQAIAWLNDGYWTGLDLRLAWKVLGFTEAPLLWRGVENIRTAMLDMPLVGGVFAGAIAAYVVSMVAAELESDRRFEKEAGPTA
jgi:hypothetical protein